MSSGAVGSICLAAGGATALARVAFVAVARRRLNGLGATTAVTFALVLAVSALTGDPRVLLLREPLVSGLLGIVLLGSCALGRPALYGLVRRLTSERGAPQPQWDELRRTRPAFRRGFTVMSLVWGAGLLTEAAVRTLLIFLLPIDTAAGASTLVQVAAIVLLGGWSLAYRRRRQSAAANPAGAEASDAR